MNVVREEFDRILEVNGVRGNSVELAKALGILVFFGAQVELPNLGKMFFFWGGWTCWLCRGWVN